MAVQTQGAERQGWIHTPKGRAGAAITAGVLLVGGLTFSLTHGGNTAPAHRVRPSAVATQPKPVAVPPAATAAPSPEAPVLNPDNPQSQLDYFMTEYSALMNSSTYDEAVGHVRNIVYDADSELAQNWIQYALSYGVNERYVGRVISDGTDFTSPYERTLKAVYTYYENGQKTASFVYLYTLHPKPIYVQTADGIEEQSRWLIARADDLGPVEDDSESTT